MTPSLTQSFAPELVELTAKAIADGRVSKVRDNQTQGSYWEDPPAPWAAVEMWRESFRVEARNVLAAQATAGYLLGAAFETDPCPYTFSHTRHWCGFDTCRDS